MDIKLQYFSENENIEETTQLESEKTFTQDDVNRIVSKRLAEEKQRVEAEIAKREKALKQKEFEFESKKLLREKGLSENFTKILKGDDIETLSASAEILSEYIKSRIQTQVQTHREGIDSGAGSGYYSSNNSSHIRNAMGLR